MAREERILAIDIGATSIKLCEFVYGSGKQMKLVQFAHREFEEELSDSTRMNVVAGLLRQMMAEGGFKARKALLSLSGQSALMRFGRLPQMLKYDRKQIKQMAEFEATNNIPFPVDQVVWDYQLVAAQENDQIDLLSVVIKNEVVDQFTQAVMSVGINPVHVDIAPVACFNAACASGIGKDECVIILNIGGRSTSLLFIEGNRFFARSIPTAGHSITQQIAKEFSIGLPEAEELKRRHGFVALGGSYAEPESETAANVSKIIRTVMSRLHGEISRSISVYKSQQKGSAPVKMYLTGGSSILNYCDVFFQEKLDIPVEYLNPFQPVVFGPNIDRAKLGEVAHMFSEPVGLALRYNQSCPIEINLLPRKIARQQALQAKKPFLVVAGLVIIATLAIIEYGLKNSAATYQQAAQNLQTAAGYKADLDEINAKLGLVSGFKASSDEMAAELMKKCLIPNIYHEIALLRPDYVTVSSIRPIYAEEDLDQTEIEEDDLSMLMPGMMEMEMPDMSMMGEDGMLMEMERYSTEEKTIYGYEITGYCYMPKLMIGQTWNPSQRTWTDFSSIIELEQEQAEEEQAEPAETPEENDEDEENAEDGEEGEEKKTEPKKEVKPVKPEEPKDDFVKVAELMNSKSTPDQAFMEALLCSPLFDASVNPRHTFVSKRVYAYPKRGVNREKYLMNWFSIKVKLAENARTTYNEYKNLMNSQQMGGPGMMMR